MLAPADAELVGIACPSYLQTLVEDFYSLLERRNDASNSLLGAVRRETWTSAAWPVRVDDLFLAKLYSHNF